MSIILDMYMSGIKTNEREISGKIADWLNVRIALGGYPFTEVTNETGIKLETSTRFGDVVIWKNRENEEAFSYIVIKPPFGAKENLETFRLKAVQLKVKYAFTWDFQNLNIFKVDENQIHLHIVEVNGRINLGEGALDNMTYEADQCLIIDPELKIKVPNSNKILSRKIKPVFEEVKQKYFKVLLNTNKTYLRLNFFQL